MLCPNYLILGTQSEDCLRGIKDKVAASAL